MRVRAASYQVPLLAGTAVAAAVARCRCFLQPVRPSHLTPDSCAGQPQTHNRLPTRATPARAGTLRTSVYWGRIQGIPVFLLKPADGSGSNIFRGTRIYGGSYNEMEAYLYFCRCGCVCVGGGRGGGWR